MMVGKAEQRLADEPAEVRDRVRLVQADGEAAGRATGGRLFDAVLWHGVLMYLVWLFTDWNTIPTATAQEVADIAAVGLRASRQDPNLTSGAQLSAARSMKRSRSTSMRVTSARPTTWPSSWLACTSNTSWRPSTSLSSARTETAVSSGLGCRC